MNRYKYKILLKAKNKGSLYWRLVPKNASELIDDGLLESTRFVFGNWKITKKGLQALRDWEAGSK